jgi:hypothetical protein
LNQVCDIGETEISGSDAVFTGNFPQCINGKIIAKAVVKRKPGFLYYIDGNGNVCEAKMSRAGPKKSSKKKATKKKTVKKVTKKVTRKPVKKAVKKKVVRKPAKKQTAKKKKRR